MKSLQPNLTRRRLLAALTGLASAVAIGASASPVAAATSLGTAVIFGDAFSTMTYKTVSNWPQQLAKKGLLTVTANYAADGAMASVSSGPQSFVGQVDKYLATKPTLPDFTIVYFGTEDLQHHAQDMTAAKSNYTAAIDKLVKAGANAGNKRLILVQIHDVSHDPGVATKVRPAVVDFNKFIQRIYKSRPNLVSVNLGNLMDVVYAHPERWDLTNVSTVDAEHSDTTALYFEPLHFGKKGQSIIAGKIRRFLTPS